MKFNELLNKALTNGDSYSLLGKLMSIASVILASTVACEREFRKMNVIENSFMSSITAQSLNDLMLISLNGPSVEEFNPSKALDHWCFSAKGMRHLHGQKVQQVVQ
jgi:hypothetical protein